MYIFLRNLALTILKVVCGLLRVYYANFMHVPKINNPLTFCLPEQKQVISASLYCIACNVDGLDAGRHSGRLTKFFFEIFRVFNYPNMTRKGKVPSCCTAGVIGSCLQFLEPYISSWNFGVLLYLMFEMPIYCLIFL